VTKAEQNVTEITKLLSQMDERLARKNIKYQIPHRWRQVSIIFLTRPAT